MERNYFNNTDIKEQLERTHRELAVLYNFSNVMRTSLELQHVLYIILTGITAHSGLGFNRAILFLVNKSNRRLEAKMAIGPDSSEEANEIWKSINVAKKDLGDLINRDNISLQLYNSKLFQKVKHLEISLDPSNNNLLTQVYHKGTPMLLREKELKKYKNSPLLDLLSISELAIVPLKAQDIVKGLIVADNFVTKKSITDDDLKIFAMMANQAGLAIENSQLFEIVVQKSRRDSLTTLWNHGYMQSTLDKELKKTKTNNSHLCLLMIDIDNFKQFNDAHGHRYGDMVLRELSDILKDSSRDRDHVCRYGGEEFSIILTETDKERGFDIAQRLREKIMHHAFTSIKPNENIKITVSIGLAAFPDDADSKEELIEKADKAMYIAKFSGKNQVCIFTENS